jgi:hypothetical protein
MRENIHDVTEDGTLEILEFVGDVAVYVTFSGYHNPIAAAMEHALGLDPVMFALHVVRYNDDTVFTSKGNANHFTEEEGLLHREFFRVSQILSEDEDTDIRECRAYFRTQQVIEAVKNGNLSYEIAPVPPGKFELV